MGGVGWGRGVVSPNIFKFAKSWSKVSDAAREFATVFSVTFFFLVKIVG